MLGHLVSNAAFHGGRNPDQPGGPNLLQRLWSLLFKRAR